MNHGSPILINMNRGDLIRTMQAEIQSLNEEIDLRIIKGFDYRRESRRHKFLVYNLARLTAPQESNWMDKAYKMVGTFMF